MKSRNSRYLGRNLEYYRRLKGLTKRELATIVAGETGKKIDTLTSQYSCWVRGEYAPRDRTLNPFADVLGVTIEELYRRKRPDVMVEPRNVASELPFEGLFVEEPDASDNHDSQPRMMYLHVHFKVGLTDEESDQLGKWALGLCSHVLQKHPHLVASLNIGWLEGIEVDVDDLMEK